MCGFNFWLVYFCGFYCKTYFFVPFDYFCHLFGAILICTVNCGPVMDVRCFSLKGLLFIMIVLFSLDTDECNSNPCQNNGNCKNLLNRFSCTCPVDYTGLTCEIRKYNSDITKNSGVRNSEKMLVVSS